MAVLPVGLLQEEVRMASELAADAEKGGGWVWWEVWRVGGGGAGSAAEMCGILKVHISRILQINQKSCFGQTKI